MRCPVGHEVKLFRAKGINNDLGFKIPDLDAFLSGSTQPVTVGGEAKAVDDISGIKTVKTLAFVQVPKHGGTILSSGGTERTIWGDTDSVEVSGVSNKVVAELAVSQAPNLDKTVPTTTNNEGNRLRR